MLILNQLTEPFAIHDTDALLARLNRPAMPVRKPVVADNVRRYRTRDEAKNAAVAVLGPLARHEFEFETSRVDGWWLWRATGEVRTPTMLEAKKSGGKHAAARIHAARRAPIVKITLELPPEQAQALAQLAARLTFEDIQRLSDGEGDMDTAVAKLGAALKSAGFVPLQNGR